MRGKAELRGLLGLCARPIALVCTFLIVVLQASAYQVSVGTYVCNAGRQITVPVMLDSASGLSYAGATLAYDPQVLVVTKAEAGSLKALMADDFTAVDTNGTVSVTIFGSPDANVVSGSGSIALVTFAVRDGTAGLYSDIAVVDVQLGEKTGVLDVTDGNPARTASGMVRVVGADAAVSRLENPQTVCAGTALASLSLQSGDALQADDAQAAPVAVAGAVTGAAGAIPVRAPVYGWASGTYPLLSTVTAGLAFELEGVEAEFSSAAENGVTTYYATVSIAGEVPIVCDTEVLGAGTKAQIRDYVRMAIARLDPAAAATALIRDRFENGPRILVTGPADATVSLISDMGLAPAMSVEDGVLKLAYAMPSLRFTSFNPANGAVGILVTPGAGNSIVADINTAYVHVYGAERLGGTFQRITQVGFDFSKYLKEETKGEGTLYVTLGSHSFLKVKVEVNGKAD